MLVKDFITKEIPVLKSFDTGEYALELMDDYKVRHLPLVSDDLYYYRFMVSEKELLSSPENLEQPLLEYSSMENYFLRHFIRPNAHALEVLALMDRYQLSLLPVVSEQEEYMGVVTQEKLISEMAELCQVDVSGSILVVEVARTDYSLMDIVRLVESNGAHILSILTHVQMATGYLWVTIRIDKEDASSVIRSLERFNYVVVWYYMKNGVMDDIFQQRVNEFIHYINI